MHRPIIRTLMFFISAATVTASRIHLDGSVSTNSPRMDSSISSQTPIADHQSPIQSIQVHDRSKRQDRLATPYQFSDADIRYIVDEHNRLRRGVPASDMRRISWDSSLATSAQSVANRCTFAHSTNRVNTGENIYAAPFSDYRGAFKFWFDEVYDRDCACTNYYKHCCGHFTQMVWSSTSKIGCGFAKCTNILYTMSYQRYLLVCHYSPAGNIITFNNGRMIGAAGFTYKAQGERACARCDSGACCDDGLCV